MHNKSFITGLSFGLLLAVLAFNTSLRNQVVADEQGERITKEKNIQMFFDESNPEGNVDLKKIVEDELQTPAECDQPMVICQIKSVGFDINIKKEWLKLDLAELNNHDFASTVPKIQKTVDKLDKPETVVLQETLARRGLLTHLDGSIVNDRGFFGALTWLGLIRLGNIKGLNDNDPNFFQQLTDEVNNLLDNMANNADYVSERPLPKQEDMIPGQTDDLFDLWSHYYYLAQLAQNAKKVDPGQIPLQLGEDVNIDGFVNVERVEQ